MRAIKVTLLELREFKTTFDQNKKAFEQMAAEVKQKTTVKVLEKIADHYCSGVDTSAEDAEDAHRMVALQVASRFGLTLKAAPVTNKY